MAAKRFDRETAKHHCTQSKDVGDGTVALSEEAMKKYYAASESYLDTYFEKFEAYAGKNVETHQYVFDENILKRDAELSTGVAAKVSSADLAEKTSQKSQTR